MKVTPDFIPDTEFHMGKWLLSASRPTWYYFWKKRNPNIITNNSFIESVDEPLRELVKFFHEKGIRTTPSCSGHHKSERNFEKIFLSLEEDKEDINGKCLDLTDVETGKHHLYKNKKYKLPWDKETFVEKAANYQQDGVIGIKMRNHKKLKEKILDLNINGATISQKDGIIFIHTREANGGDIREIWKKITEEVKNV